jgi:hypothetical protein
MENKGIRWSDYEEEALLREIKTLSISEIASLHKRSYRSITMRLSKHAINELEKIGAISSNDYSTGYSSSENSMDDIERIAGVYKISVECLLENIDYHKRPKRETKDMIIKRLEKEISALKMQLAQYLDSGFTKVDKCIGCVRNHPSQKYHLVSNENKFGCI